MRALRLLLLTLPAVLAAGAALAEVVVPVRAIRSQSVITAADLEIADDTVPGALTEIALAVGQEARVTLYPGRPILAGQVGAPALVERNQLVRMVYAAGGLSITAEGRALDRAGAGEMVRVMNLASRQIVTGAVATDGSIEVGTR
jgi:flagella basal body P-ring formation protein FlgA